METEDIWHIWEIFSAYINNKEKEDAIKGWRALMGATNPEAAEANTLRKLYGKNIDNNAVHGSDAPETAAEEVAFFFTGIELM